ncbi:Flavocytochrome c [Meredithblackwellia eburnea MCA 4105]
MSQVIVVGGGLSGLSAAHTLYERGANVLLLDKNSFMGGNSTKATSGINGAGTQAQAKLNIRDTPKAFFDDTKKSARELARDDLIKVLTGKSGDAVNWLMDKFALDLSKVSRLGGHSFERTHRGGAQFPGMTITYAQMEALEDLAISDPTRVKILKKATVTSLIRSPTGDREVTGVNYEYNGEKLQAHGPVVLATGGYAADFAKDGLLNKYRPDLMHLPTTNGDHCTGDGQKMVLDIGGRGIDLEKVQVHPTGLVDPKEPDAKVKFLAAEALRGVGGLLLDGEGNRFADELGHRDYVTGRIWDNNKYPVRLILNGQASKEIDWHCKHYCGRGLMKRFETGAELAKEMGLSEAKLKKTFDDYMKVVKDPKTDPWGKKFFSNTDWGMNSGPFNVAIMTPVLHYTMGGLEIDDNSRVIDTAGQPIPGLFASGEIAGGVHGANRLGGSSLLGCVVFGRVAGDSAASFLLSTLSSQTAANRLGQVGGHLGMATTVRIDPSSKKVHLEFSWDENGSTASSSSSSSSSAPAPAAAAAAPAPAKEEKKELKEYTLEEVAKHNKDDDVWVVVNGQVIDCTKFLPEHPGGPKAILLYKGKDASEEFNMVHEKSVIAKYASEYVVGTLKA